MDVFERARPLLSVCCVHFLVQTTQVDSDAGCVYFAVRPTVFASDGGLLLPLTAERVDALLREELGALRWEAMKEALPIRYEEGYISSERTVVLHVGDSKWHRHG